MPTEQKKGERMTAPDYREFNDLLAKARAFKLAGWWQGSSFRSHPCGVIRRNIIFANMWNTNGFCYASVILDPSSPIKPGMNCSAAYGDSYPHPERGGELRVYWTGSWSGDDGPWQQAILDVLGELRGEIEVAEAAAKEAREATQRDHEAQHAAALEQARKAVAHV